LSTKPLLKHARALQQKKYRDLHGTYLVQGPKVVGELLRSGVEVEVILATAQAADRLGIRDPVIVPPHELDRIGTLGSGNEVIAIARKPAPSPVVDLGPEELVIALDGIADPGNLGTVLRVADWFGIHRVWCSTGSVEAYNPKCVQASMGAIFRVRVDQVDLPELLERQHRNGGSLYFASMEGRSVLEERLSRKAVLVLGSESHGLSPEVRGLPGVLIGIPGGGGAESLNVAMAASALCMEFTRQRMA
jgi:TrmH family RNA methyltransferase